MTPRHAEFASTEEQSGVLLCAFLEHWLEISPLGAVSWRLVQLA